MSEPKRLQSAAEVAERLGVSKRTVDVWRSRNYGPAWLKVGRAIRYDPDAVEKWLETTEKAPS